jgi:2-amino-4-hydroxy-6-hydroxymethyldihydropteridine diphosphokinase
MSDHLAAIALGSNLPSRFGGPEANLREAIIRLGAVGQVVAVSSFHLTQPVGFRDQPEFTNAAALLSTCLESLELLRSLLRIEREMGRDRSNDAPPKGPRIIDLDLLLVDDLRLSTPELLLPHPEIIHRRFVLEPLAEIAPGLIYPATGQNILELLRRLP